MSSDSRWLKVALLVVPILLGTGSEVAWAQAEKASAEPSASEPAPQQSDRDDPDAEPQAELEEEITVTAQKRAQRLSDVPLAITALDADTIEASKLEKIEEVEALTPNLHFQTIGVSRPQVHLRGVGTGAFDAGSDPSVAVFIDEVYLARFGAMQFDLFDLERIEILKGPQGALFGRNTAGGAINIVTKRPSEVFAGRVEVGGGNLDTLSARALVNGALGEKVFGRLSAALKQRDGYTDNLTTGDDENDEDSTGARFQLQFQPGDRTSLLVSGDGGRDRLSMWGMESITNQIFLLFPPLHAVFQPTPDLFSEPYTRGGYQDRDQLGLSVRLDQETAVGTFTSLTAYRESEFDELQDFDSTRADVLDRLAVEDGSTFTQELRLASSAGGRVDWLVGAYYLQEEVDRLDEARLGIHDVLAVAFNGGRPYATVTTDRFDTEAYAGFAQVTIGLADALNLSLGGRYGEDDKEMIRAADNNGVVSPILPAPFTATVSDSWSSFDAQVSLDYRVGDRTLTYLSYREGFKSGGFQYGSPTAAASSITFDPETVALIEGGVKTRSRRGRVAFDAAVFTTDYEDLQFLAATGETAGGGFIIAITNAAQATVDGVELDLRLRPVSGFELGLAYGYLDATFDEYIDGNGNDQSGNTLLRAPENSGSLVAQYSLPLSRDAGVLIFRGAWSYKDEIYFDPDNTERLGQPSYDLLDGSVSWETEGGAWRVSAWGKNLSDEVYFKNVIPLSSSLVGVATLGVPRTYGITVGRDW